MTAITVMRTDIALPANMEAASDLLFRSFDGYDTASRRAWRRVWKRMTSMEPGELVQVDMSIPRNGKFHRKFFALLNVGFECWQSGRKHKTHNGQPVIKNFDTFREDIIVLAGFYEQHFDVRGRLVLKAKSIKYSKMDDMEFEKLYDAVADKLLEHVLTTYNGRTQPDEVVEKIMRFHS